MNSSASIAIRRLRRRSRLQELQVEAAETVCRQAAEAERLAATAVQVHGQRLEAASQQIASQSTSRQSLNVRALEVHLQAWNSLMAWSERLAAEELVCIEALQTARGELQTEKGKHAVLERVLAHRIRQHAREREVAESLAATDIWTAGRYYRNEL